MLRTDGRIDDDVMSRAQAVVDSVNELVYNQLIREFPQFKMRPTEPIVLQGSVADGTKVLAPDEFDYIIPMDLCAEHWDIVQTFDLYLIFKRDDFQSCSKCEGGINCTITYDQSNAERYFGESANEILEVKRINEDVMFQKSLNNAGTNRGWWKRFKKCFSRKVKQSNRQKDRAMRERISAHDIFHTFEAIFHQVWNYTDTNSPKDFAICDVHSRHGPAITMTVEYKSGIDLDETISTLNIDYIPAVCCGERCFVPKWHAQFSVSMDWRESFSHIELQLMKQIQSQAPALFKLFLTIKAFHSTIKLAVRTSQQEHGYSPEKGIPPLKEIYDQYISSEDATAMIFIRLFSGTDPLDWDLIYKFNNDFIRLHSYHLKTMLLHLWKRQELREADEETLAAAFITIIRDCLPRNRVLNYFNGKELRI